MILNEMQLHSCSRFKYQVDRTISDPKGKKWADKDDEDDDDDDDFDKALPHGAGYFSPSPAKQARTSGSTDVSMATA